MERHFLHGLRNNVNKSNSFASFHAEWKFLVIMLYVNSEKPVSSG